MRSGCASFRRAGTRPKKELAQAREDRDSLQNVLNGYGLRLESRRKKAKEAEERHVKLQMEENALHSRIHMLSEMEKLYEGYSKAVKLVMGEAGGASSRGSTARWPGCSTCPTTAPWPLRPPWAAPCSTLWWSGRRTARPPSSTSSAGTAAGAPSCP